MGDPSGPKPLLLCRDINSDGDEIVDGNHTYAGRIVGWRVSASAHAGFLLDALEQTVHERCPGKGMGLVHHSDRGSQYLSICYSERLAAAGIETRSGSNRQS